MIPITLKWVNSRFNTKKNLKKVPQIFGSFKNLKHIIHGLKKQISLSFLRSPMAEPEIESSISLGNNKNFVEKTYVETAVLSKKDLVKQDFHNSTNLLTTPVKPSYNKTPTSRTQVGIHIGPVPYSKYSPLKREFLNLLL